MNTGKARRNKVTERSFDIDGDASGSSIRLYAKHSDGRRIINRELMLPLILGDRRDLFHLNEAIVLQDDCILQYLGLNPEDISVVGGTFMGHCYSRPLRLTVDYFYHMFYSIAYLHSMGVVHGAISIECFASNVSSDYKFNPTTCDLYNCSIFRQRTHKYESDYIAPEIAETDTPCSQFSTKQTDVYAIGKCIKSLLDSLKVVYVKRIYSNDIIGYDVPVELLEELADKCTLSDLDGRFNDATEILEVFKLHYPDRDYTLSPFVIPKIDYPLRILQACYELIRPTNKELGELLCTTRITSSLKREMPQYVAICLSELLDIKYEARLNSDNINCLLPYIANKMILTEGLATKLIDALRDNDESSD